MLLLCDLRHPILETLKIGAERAKRVENARHISAQVLDLLNVG
jgi:hypothetical protein